jgi:hypothetical protein
MKTVSIKKEETQDMENLRKKNKTECKKKKVEGQYSKLQQAEDRISELEDKMVKEKLKNY